MTYTLSLCLSLHLDKGKSAKKILRMMMDGDEKSAQDIASGLGLLLPPPSSTSSEEEVQRICNGILEANPEKVRCLLWSSSPPSPHGLMIHASPHTIYPVCNRCKSTRRARNESWAGWWLKHLVKHRKGAWIPDG